MDCQGEKAPVGPAFCITVNCSRSIPLPDNPTNPSINPSNPSSQSRIANFLVCLSSICPASLTYHATEQLLSQYVCYVVFPRPHPPSHYPIKTASTKALFPTTHQSRQIKEGNSNIFLQFKGRDQGRQFLTTTQSRQIQPLPNQDRSRKAFPASAVQRQRSRRQIKETLFS